MAMAQTVYAIDLMVHLKRLMEARLQHRQDKNKNCKQV